MTTILILLHNRNLKGTICWNLKGTIVGILKEWLLES